jgi:hypothetical protein
VEPEQVELRCARCGREPRADEKASEWLARSDRTGGARTLCPECAALEPEDPYVRLRRELAEQLDRDTRPLWRRMLGF